MAKERFEANEQVKTERCQVELVQLIAGANSSSLATLQEAVNKGTRQSWRLVGVEQHPTSQGVLIVWDTSGFISG